MPYKLFYHPAIKKDLQKIPADIKAKIQKVIEDKLVEDPVAIGIPLRQSLKGHRKVRIGGWRIIYRINKEDIIILKIGHRKEVYQHAVRRKK